MTMKQPTLLSPGDWEMLQSPDKSLSSKPLDPYLWWLDVTGFRALRRADKLVTTFSFIAQGNLATFRNEIMRPVFEERVSIDDEYALPLPNNRLSTYWTFRVSIFQTNGGVLDDAEVINLFKALLALESVVRLQAGFARGDTDADGSSIRRSSDSIAREIAPVVIAVIDDGCAFAHARLRSGATCSSLGTRVSVVWNQSSFKSRFTNAQCTWYVAPTFGYGAIAPKRELDTLMNAHIDPGGEVDEIAVYRATTSPSERNRVMATRESHGAAVSMLAAGSLGKARTTVSDAAALAPLIFVDLPIEQVEISSGRWMPVNGLDAMRFSTRWARTHYTSKKTATVPVVINLSSGSNAGAHDGQSMFECAMEEMLAADDLLSIALAAGNSRLSETHLVKNIEKGTSANLDFFVPSSKQFETYVEFWLPKDWNRDDLSVLSVQLRAASGAETPLNKAGKTATLSDDQGRIIAGINFCINAVQSINRSMILVTIASTQTHHRRPYAMGGRWSICLHNNHTSKSLVVEAWIERDEVVFGLRRPQYARFFDDATSGDPIDIWQESAGRSVRRDGTLSNIANGGKTFAVAAGTGGVSAGYASSYSGAPTTSRPSPTFVARADRNAAKPGILVSGNLRGAMRHMNGSSVAAPIATRWLANEMANGKTRSMIASGIPTGPSRIDPHTGATASRDGRKNLSDIPAQLGE
jgi:Subtilase family